MTERTNEERAARALAALDAYRQHEKERTIDVANIEDTKESITDLLTDLHHLLRVMAATEAAGTTMLNLLDTARRHYLEEVK